MPMDTDCDLFSSPGDGDRKCDEFEVMVKAINALEVTVNKHRSAVEQLR